MKSPSKCTEHYRCNLKRKLAKNCSDSLLWFESEGYTAMNMIHHCNKTGESRTVSLDTSGFLGPDKTTIIQKQVDTLNMMLYVKDKYNISGDAYHEMAQFVQEYATPLQVKGSNCQLKHIMERSCQKALVAHSSHSKSI